MCSFSRRDFIQSYALASAGVWLGHGGGADGWRYRCPSPTTRTGRAAGKSPPISLCRGQVPERTDHVAARPPCGISSPDRRTSRADGRSAGANHGDDRWRRLSGRKTRLRKPARLFRSASLSTEENPVTPARGSGPVRSFIGGQGRRNLSGPPRQPGKARICGAHVRPGGAG